MLRQEQKTLDRTEVALKLPGNFCKQGRDEHCNTNAANPYSEIKRILCLLKRDQDCRSHNEKQQHWGPFISGGRGKTSALRSNCRSVADDPGALAECLHVHKGLAVALQSTNTTMPLQDFSHSEKHQVYYLKKYLRQIVEGLSFSKDVLEQQGLSYKEYNFKHLYDASGVIQKPKSAIAMHLKRSVKLYPQKQPLSPVKNDGLSPKLRKEDSLWGSKLEASPKKLSLPPVPSCKTPGVQASLAKPCGKLSGSLTRGRQEKQDSEKNIPGSEKMTCGVEKTGRESLSRMTAQWTMDQQRARGGSVQCNPLDFGKQKFAGNTIRDELCSDRSLKILDDIQGKGSDTEIISQTQAEKTPGTVLPISCSGPPGYYSRVLSTDDPADTNVTADDTEIKCLNPESSMQRHVIARVGKYSYTPKNAFEQELYFGTAKIVHQVDERMKDHFILDNYDQYCKHLQQPFPRQPECWGCKPQRRAAWRPRKGALRWIALPTLTPYIVHNEEESPPTKAREVQKESQGSNKEVPWDIQVLRTMLEQWKDAWNLHPQWRNITTEGLMRSLTSVHDISRIKAIIACASAAVEQHGRKTSLQEFNERSSHLQAADLHVVAVTDSAGKSSVTHDGLAELQPLLRETLRDENAHVRMASALCHYAIGKRNEEAQSILKDALAHGNSADSWAAAQCLALESTVAMPVVTKLLSRLFEKSDAAAEEQACLLLAHLGERTPLVRSLLTAQLNSPRWTARARACRALPGAGGHFSQDLTNKLSQLMWKDWNARVRQAATLTLGHMKLAKEIHDQLRVKLTTGNCQTKVQALSLIRELQFMTAKLFPGFLQCFSSDFVAVRKEACLTAGALGIKDERVLQFLYEMMQYDPHWKIKVFAIRALGQIGHVSPQLKHLLLWALHYEEEPEVRREACCCIARLHLQDENVRAMLLERLILEPNEMVRE
ncbi:HEAT repeat-containing protein 4 [Struthio camelus]|uniref:HEAT repeat-containing protein 4 n=1 Tax=Struthio camelus TaxID=8801 RepID=UPI0036042D90